MSSQPFDALTVTFAQAQTRRDVLRRLGQAVALTAVGALGAAEVSQPAAAKRRHPKSRPPTSTEPAPAPHGRSETADLAASGSRCQYYCCFFCLKYCTRCY
jgi:hypothetical protein